MQICDLAKVEVKNVGKVIKNTKRRYLWKFRLHSEETHSKNMCGHYSVTLIDSTVSLKRTVILNGTETLLDNEVK